MNAWSVLEAAFETGGTARVPRSQAPLGRLLPYRRSCGEPPPPTGYADQVRNRGWQVDLGDRGLGDLLLGLALARALHDMTGDATLRYEGSRPDLIRRTSLPVTALLREGPHIIRTVSSDPVAFTATPEEPPTWLDIVDDGIVDVHAALPMRYYLAAEQALGERLPVSHEPAPAFRSAMATSPFHVVFVSATSWPGRKDYGAAGFLAVAEELSRRCAAAWRFTLVTGETAHVLPGVEVLTRPDAASCIDVFATAELVIGNDTGLTHLAALTRGADGTGPHVLGLYGRHSHTKWTTGSARHHTVATPFARMLSAADRCPVRDGLDDSVWSTGASLVEQLPPHRVAEFAGSQVGWWSS